jgi:parallel beta-helix repeat protein
LHRNNIIISSIFAGIVNISANGVLVSGFQIIYNRSYNILAGGPILINSDNNNISGNHLKEGDFGIFIKNSSNNSIFNNFIFSNHAGVLLYFSYNNFISGNTIDGNGGGSSGGVYISDSYNNILSHNFIVNNANGRGIWITESYQNKIYMNTMKLNLMGMHLQWAHKNEIKKNNFIMNWGGAAYFEEGGLTNIWDGNYWNRPRILPKLVFGDIWILNIVFYCFKVDWHPASKPYDIRM